MSELSNIAVVRNLLEKHGFHFSKSLGQNFLINPSVCPKMAEQCGAGKEWGVLEIGPGIGVLTMELSKVAGKVVSIELDQRLFPVLEETLSECSNVKILPGDAMRLDLKEILEKEFPGMPVAICANLPYYITSPLIMRLLEEKLPVQTITVMVQKEAAERLCAPPGSRACGAVSMAVQYYARPEVLFSVSRGSFMPAPNVDSAVIRLNIRKEPAVSLKDEKLFFKVVKAAFGQRRKTLGNSLSAGLSLPKEQILAACEEAKIAPTARAEQLTMEEMAKLADSLCRDT